MQVPCAVEAVLPGEGALPRAKAGFQKAGFHWVEAHAHDPIHGGFHVFFREDGRPIVGIDTSPLGRPLDPLGIPIGYRGINDVGNLIEARVELHRHWRDPVVVRRIEERVAIVRPVAGRSGGLSDVLDVGGGSVCHPVHIGHQLRRISRLRLVEPLLGEGHRLLEPRRLLLELRLCMGLDRPRGGFVFALPEIISPTLPWLTGLSHRAGFASPRRADRWRQGRRIGDRHQTHPHEAVVVELLRQAVCRGECRRDVLRLVDGTRRQITPGAHDKAPRGGRLCTGCGSRPWHLGADPVGCLGFRHRLPGAWQVRREITSGRRDARGLTFSLVIPARAMQP